MLLAQHVTAPSRTLSSISLTGLSVAAVLPEGDGGIYRIVAAQPTGSGYTGRQTLPSTFLVRSSSSLVGTSFLHRSGLRLPSTATLPRLVSLTVVSNSPTHSVSEVVPLTGLNVSGALLVGSFGQWQRLSAALPQTPPSRSLNFSDVIPSPPTGFRNIRWQVDSTGNARNISGYVPLASMTSAGLIPLTGDLAGNATVPKVAGLQGIPVASTAPANNQVLTFDAAAGTWQPKLAGGGTAAGSFAILANGSTIAASDTAGFTFSLNGTPIARYS